MSMEFDDDFLACCGVQQRDNVTFRHELLYTNTLGDYANIPLVGDEPPYCVESFLVLRTQMTLAMRERQDRTDPARIIDVGAGVGATATKLAGFFKEKVLAGELEVYATSTGLERGYYFEAAHKRVDAGVGTPLRLARAEWMHERYGDNVTYLTTNMSHILALPDDLLGTFDIVHERNAVTPWSRIPGLHIRRIGELVAPDGMYMVDKQATERVLGPSNSYDTQQRLGAIQDAHQALQTDYGMTMTDAVQAGAHAGQDMTYRAFLGPDALPVTTYLPTDAGG